MANRLGHPEPPSPAGRVWVAWLVKLLTLLAMAAIPVLLATNWGQVVRLVWGLTHSPGGWAFLIACQAILLLNLGVFIWRLVLVWMYRPPAPLDDDRLPTCSVMVPAYNEGRSVVQTLLSLVGCDYPAGKLQIIAVDDGSRDDTWQWMNHAAGLAAGRVELLRLATNRGKRHALCEGFRLSRGEILVTVDSDSIVEPSALRRLASAFAGEPKVGAVGGNIRVLNRTAGVIPRMLDVSFAYSFDFIRSSQSMVDTVMCIPGALAAYRREVVMGVLDEWSRQTFMGSPANIGEDRALTNLILRAGFLCRYQGQAVCRTAVPTDYAGLCRMFIRWARSNVRETLAMGRFAFTRFRSGHLAGARVNLIHQAIGMFLNPFLMIIAVCLVAPYPAGGAANLLLGCAVASSVPAIFYAFRARSLACLWAFPYGLFWLTLLAWINVYSILTPHKSAWLTRQLSAPPAPAAQAGKESELQTVQSPAK